jgi:hypothetical protein
LPKNSKKIIYLKQFRRFYGTNIRTISLFLIVYEVLMKARLILKIAVVACVLPATTTFAGLNPANPGLPQVTSQEAFGASGGNPINNNNLSAMCIECHTNNPKPNAGTHFIAHFDGTGIRTTTDVSIIKLDAWTSGALSKYGKKPVTLASQSVTGETGDMICESCHNLIKNVAGGNNLVDTYRADLADPTPLCEGCHQIEAAGTPNHHPLTNDTVGGDLDDPLVHDLTQAHPSHVTATPAGNDVFYPVGTGLVCASCHRPHGAAEGAGARILNRGSSNSTNLLFKGKEVNLLYADVFGLGDTAGDIKIWDTGDTTKGIDRLEDIQTLINPLYLLVINQDPLCEACHRP